VRALPSNRLVVTPAAGGVGSEREPPPAGVDLIEKWLHNSDSNLAPHLLLVGRSGAGKTTVARTILMYAIREGLFQEVVLDWDNEYADYLPLEVFEPPFPISSAYEPLADSVAEIERSEEGGHMVANYIRKILLETASLKKAAERLRMEALSSLKGVLEAAAARLETVAKYTETRARARCEGVYLLSTIPSIWERAAVQQFLATYITFTKSDPVPTLLVIEEGGMGARTTFLRHLLALARRRNVKVMFITQGPLPPPELRSSFEILLFDCDWELRRSLRAPIPDSQLGVGECWWVRRSGAPKKLRFKAR